MAAEKNKIAVIDPIDGVPADITHFPNPGEARIDGHPLISNVVFRNFKNIPQLLFFSEGAKSADQVNNILSKAGIKAQERKSANVTHSYVNSENPDRRGGGLKGFFHVALKNVDDLPEALKALNFDAASANQIIVLSQREIIAYQEAQISSLKQKLKGLGGIVRTSFTEDYMNGRPEDRSGGSSRSNRRR